MIIAKWVLVLVLTEYSGNSSADSVAVTQIPMESRELCLAQANFLRKQNENSYGAKMRTYCIQSSTR